MGVFVGRGARVASVKDRVYFKLPLLNQNTQVWVHLNLAKCPRGFKSHHSLLEFLRILSPNSIYSLLHSVSTKTQVCGLFGDETSKRRYWSESHSGSEIKLHFTLRRVKRRIARRLSLRDAYHTAGVCSQTPVWGSRVTPRSHVSPKPRASWNDTWAYEWLASIGGGMPGAPRSTRTDGAAADGNRTSWTRTFLQFTDKQRKRRARGWKKAKRLKPNERAS